MIKIYKYELPAYGDAIIQRNQITRVLKVDSQNNKPVMWCEIDTLIDHRDAHVKVYMTGETIKHDKFRYKYVGSFTIDNGAYIGHVYCDKGV